MWELEWQEPCLILLVSFCLYLEFVWFSSPSQSFCPALFIEIMHNASAKRWLLHLRQLCGQPVLSVQYHRLSKVNILGTSSTSHSIVKERRMGHLRVTSGFEVFWFISSLLAGPISSQPSLWRGFSQSTYMEYTWPWFNQGSQLLRLSARRC